MRTNKTELADTWGTTRIERSLPGALLVLVALLLNLDTNFAFAQTGQILSRGTGTTPMIILDAHEDVLWRVTDRGDDMADPTAGQADIAKWRAGGVNVVWFSVWIDPRKYPGKAAPKRALQMIDSLHRQMKAHPGVFQLCDSAAECREAARAGRIAALIGIENGTAINKSIENLHMFREKHVRYMTLTWRGNHDWAGSSQPVNAKLQAGHTAGGLTDFGKQVVREMLRIGMIPDLSHASDQTFFDTLSVSNLPIICSHSNARALAKHPRNVTDDMLRALKQNGGVVGINFAGEYLKPGNRSAATVETALDHIDYIVKVAGVDHVGFGSDWDGGIVPARGLEDASRMQLLIDGLRKRRYSDGDVRKIAGENFLRVIEMYDRTQQPLPPRAAAAMNASPPRD